MSTAVRRLMTAPWYHAPPLRAAHVALIGLACTLAACAENPAPETPDEPPSPAPARTRRPAPRWARFDEVSAWTPINPKPFRSSGHGATSFLVDVRVSENLVESYRALRPGLQVPDGALVAAFHADERTGSRGPVLVMERVASRWRYSAFDRDGRATEAGTVALCERCHSESPSGGLFGLPR